MTVLDRAALLDLSTDELDSLGFRTDSLSDDAVMYIGYQRTKQMTKAARDAWNAGDKGVAAAEARAERDRILRGTFAEIWREYLPVRDYLNRLGLTPRHVADIGAGTGINDLFLARDYGTRVTMIDIEETDEQYHGWAASGAGYASLAAARALLEENGVAPADIMTINPLITPGAVDTVSPDLVTSLYSCGFHYPIDDYLSLCQRALENGGAVILDLRGSYWRRKPEGLAKLCAAGQVTEIFHDTRSLRIGVHGGAAPQPSA